MPSDIALIQIDFNEKGQLFLFLGHSETFSELELSVSPNLSTIFFFLIFNLPQLDCWEENTIGGLMAQDKNVCLLDNRKGIW